MSFPLLLCSLSFGRRPPLEKALTEKEIFADLPVKKAVLKLTVPTVISQLITVIYNMADTFFIGQLNDPVQVAAATLSMPLFIFLTGFANLFGIGAASIISRDLGKGSREHAKLTSSFSIFGGLVSALVYAAFVFIMRPVLLPLLGTNQDTYPYVYQYLFWTTVIGGVPTVLSALLAHLVRTEGRSEEAGFGLMFGGLLNMVLDPIFISGLHLGIVGAAIATLISNVTAAFYFLLWILKHRGSTVITFKLRKASFIHIPKEVLLQGMPSFIMMLMSFISNAVLNHLVASYSNEAIAGMGIAKKMDMIGSAVTMGMTQGILALIGYNYAAGNIQRMKDTIRIALTYCIIITTIFSAILFIFAEPIAAVFIRESETVRYGEQFLRIICLTLPATSITMMVITTFQAVGFKKQPMALSLLRKGGLDVPVMLVMNVWVGVFGIACGTPIADLIAMVISVCLYLVNRKKIYS